MPDKDVSIPEFTTARKHYLNMVHTIERLSTGSRNVDNLLCGGVETKAVTEFYGVVYGPVLVKHNFAVQCAL